MYQRSLSREQQTVMTFLIKLRTEGTQTEPLASA